MMVARPDAPFVGVGHALVLVAVAAAASGVAFAQRRAATALPPSVSPIKNIPYADAKPIIETFREHLPRELSSQTVAQLESLWPAWVSRRDREIRARLDRGNEDSAVNFLLLGTTFTTRPRVLARGPRLGSSPQTDDILRGRIEDLIAAIVAPGSNERL